MPLVPKAFADLITFSRSSESRFVGSNGLIQTAAVNAPRFDYDPVTLLPRGLLIEEQRANLFQRSQELDNAYWNKGSCTITPNASAAPDGTTTASKIVGTGSNPFISRSDIFPLGNAVLSIFAKKSELNFLRLSRTSVSIGAWFDLNSGVIGTVQGGAAASMKNFGNGWYLCSIFTAGSVATDDAIIAVTNADGVTTDYIGNGSSGLFVWGAQLESGSFPSSYIPTTTASVTRAVENVSVNTLSPWYRADEGTLFVEASSFGAGLGGSAAFATIGLNATATNRIAQIDQIPSGTLRGSVFNQSSVSQAILSIAGTFNTTIKSALAYKSNDVAFSANGSAAISDNSATIDAVPAKLFIGSTSGSSQMANGHIRQIKYFPRRLSDAELQTLTAL